MDNSACAKPVDSVIVRLRQSVKLESGSGLPFLYSRLIDQQVFDGIQPNQSTNGLTRTLSLDLKAFKSQGSPLSQHPDANFLASMLEPSSKGRLIEIKYSVDIVAHFQGACQRRPTVSLPLVLIPPKLPSYADAKKPEGWTPEIYESTRIDASKHRRMFTESKLQTDDTDLQAAVDEPAEEIILSQPEHSIRISVEGCSPRNEDDLDHMGMALSVSADGQRSVTIDSNQKDSLPSYKKPFGLTIDVDQANSGVPVSETPLRDDKEVEYETDEEFEAQEETYSLSDY